MQDLIKLNISQAFLKALTSAQKLHCKTSTFTERPPMTASALKHEHHIFIIKSAESLKLFWYEVAAESLIEIKIC